LIHFHYNYSPSQLEDKANEFLRQFDAERLEIAKPIDVYAVIEQCLDVPYDWKYITPDQSVWGMTFFNPGYQWVWPEPRYKAGMLPEKVFYEQGTILIDSFLTELPDRGPENFTVMHEIFHQVLHKRCFAHASGDYRHETHKENLKLRTEKKSMSSLEICEYQANFCAACFLMPRVPVTAMFHRLTSHGRSDFAEESVVAQMAAAFSVSKSAMRIRLQSLGLSH
jgi:hypothetical protein